MIPTTPHKSTSSSIQWSRSCLLSFLLHFHPLSSLCSFKPHHSHAFSVFCFRPHTISINPTTTHSTQHHTVFSWLASWFKMETLVLLYILGDVSLSFHCPVCAKLLGMNECHVLWGVTVSPSHQNQSWINNSAFNWQPENVGMSCTPFYSHCFFFHFSSICIPGPSLSHAEQRWTWNWRHFSAAVLWVP